MPIPPGTDDGSLIPLMFLMLAVFVAGMAFDRTKRPRWRAVVVALVLGAMVSFITLVSSVAVLALVRLGR